MTFLVWNEDMWRQPHWELIISLPSGCPRNLAAAFLQGPTSSEHPLRDGAFILCLYVYQRDLHNLPASSALAMVESMAPGRLRTREAEVTYRHMWKRVIASLPAGVVQVKMSTFATSFTAEIRGGQLGHISLSPATEIGDMHVKDSGRDRVRFGVVPRVRNMYMTVEGMAPWLLTRPVSAID